MQKIIVKLQSNIILARTSNLPVDCIECEKINNKISDQLHLEKHVYTAYWNIVNSAI